MKSAAERAARLNKGFRGIWDWLTGRYDKQARENEREALDASRRDRREKDSLIERHLDERQSYHMLAKQVKTTHAENFEELHRYVADYMRMREPERPDAGEYSREDDRRSNRPRRPRGRRPNRSR